MEWIAFMAFGFLLRIHLNRFLYFDFCLLIWNKRINSGSRLYRPAVHSKLSSIHDHRIYLMTMNVGTQWANWDWTELCASVNGMTIVSIAVVHSLQPILSHSPSGLLLLSFYPHSCFNCYHSLKHAQAVYGAEPRALTVHSVHTCHLFWISLSFITPPYYSFAGSQLKQTTHACDIRSSLSYHHITIHMLYWTFAATLSPSTCIKIV